MRARAAHGGIVLVIDRRLLTAPNISPRAKILGAWLSTLPRDAVTRARSWWGARSKLAALLGWSARTLRRAVAELRNTGWLVTASVHGRDAIVLAAPGGGQSCPAERSSVTADADSPGRPISQDAPESPTISTASEPEAAPSLEDSEKVRSTPLRRQLEHVQYAAGARAGAGALAKIGPLVCDRSALEGLRAAIGCDGLEYVVAVAAGTARAAAAGDVPIRYWSRLFCGGGYQARRAALAEAREAQVRLRAREAQAARAARERAEAPQEPAAFGESFMLGAQHVAEWNQRERPQHERLPGALQRVEDPAPAAPAAPLEAATGSC